MCIYGYLDVLALQLLATYAQFLICVYITNTILHVRTTVKIDTNVDLMQAVCRQEIW